MNRNVLKIIAITTMLIDHIGFCLFGNNIWFRVVGRVAMPIFAFFIAEGMKYTRNRKRYVLTLLGFALISQVPHILLFGMHRLNILFTFLIAICIILLIEKIKLPIVPYFIAFTILIFSYFLGLKGNIDYGIFGVLLVLVFYFCKNKVIKYLFSAVVIVLFAINNILVYGLNASSLISFVSLASIVLLMFYNGNKGKLNLKWFFYIFYPAHLFIIYIIKVII